MIKIEESSLLDRINLLDKLQSQITLQLQLQENNVADEVYDNRTLRKCFEWITAHKMVCQQELEMLEK